MKKFYSFSSFILLALFLFSNYSFSQSPTVQSVTSFTTEGTKKVGDQIEIKVIFSESVTVTGVPTLTLETGSSDATVNYSSGSSGSILNFIYTVSSGESSSDLDYASTSALSLNSGTIKASDDNTDATLTLASPGSNGSLAEAKNYVVDGIIPTGALTYSADAPYKQGATATVTATFTEALTTAPKIAISGEM